MTSARFEKDLWAEPPNSPPVENVQLSDMKLEHLDMIVDIEQRSFPIPWSRQAFIHDLNDNKMAHYYILERDGKIAGYAGFWLLDRIAHLTTICIEEHHRGLSLGRWLLLTVMQIGSDLGALRFTLEVREKNESAIKLYESVGYNSVGKREQYYQEVGEDALIMWTGKAPFES